jgi:hypothetical protein
MRLAPALLLLAACGARSEIRSSAADGGNACLLDAGTFACADASCNSTTEYCHEVTGGPPPGVDLGECRPLPTACNVSCFTPESACYCDDQGGAIHVSCPVP